MCIRSTTPYRYNMGDKVRIMIKGDYSGKIVTVLRRFRVNTTTEPIPAYENYYEVIFEGDGHVEKTSEDDLEPI